MSTQIQYFAATYVSFKDNLNEDEKISLIKWIKEASDDQIKNLLIQGDSNFKQESVEIFDKVFGEGASIFSTATGPSIWGDVAGGSGGVGGLGAAAIAAAIVTASVVVYKRFLSKAARQCNHLTSDAKTICMIKAKTQAYNKQIEALNQAGNSKCKKAKNPGMCKDKIVAKVKTLKLKQGAKK